MNACFNPVNKGDKILCQICSDGSIGRYFGIYLCGSCKAFFRRNASKSEKFICPFTDSCEINKMTRRHCRKCRLVKCFKVGLRKEWIQPVKPSFVTEPASTVAANVTTFNLPESGSLFQGLVDFSPPIKSVPNPIPSTSSTNAGGQWKPSSFGEEATSGSSDGDEEEGKEMPRNQSNVSLVFRNLLDEAALHELLEEEGEAPMDRDMAPLTEEPHPIQRSSFECYRFGDTHWDAREDPCEFHQTHHEYMTSTTNITNCGNLVCIGAPYRPPGDTPEDQWQWKVHQRLIGANFTPISFRSEFISRRVALNQLEGDKIDELCTFALGLCKHDPFEFPSTLDVAGLLKILEISLNRLIPGLNTISAFTSLCMEDRMCLIKRSFADILFMRAAVLIDIQTETLQIPKTPITLRLEDMRAYADCYYQRLLDFIKSLKPSWRTDFKGNMLILLILLFNPDAPNLFYPDAIRLQQYNYIYLLRRYIEYRSCYVCIARTDFYNLMMKIGELEETLKSNEIIHDLALKNRDSVGPLLSEILDLV